MTYDPVSDALAIAYRGRLVVLIGRPIEQFRPLATALASVGIPPPLVVATAVPDTSPSFSVADVCVVELGPVNSIATFASTDAVLESPPAHVRRALDAFDPTYDAVVLTDARVHQQVFAGRQVLDARPAGWASFENLDRSWDIWHAVGAITPPLVTVDVRSGGLAEACSKQDLGYGVLCFGDMRATVHDPIECMRWVHDESTLTTALTWFALTSRHVWVVPRLPGTPRGITGMVIGRDVAVMRPHEEVLLVDRDTGHVWQAGHCTAVVTEDERQEEIRTLARRVGAVLARTGRFRGSFCIEGVLAAKGYVPLRLITRTARCHRHLMASGIGADWALAEGAVVGRLPFPVSPPTLERSFLSRINTITSFTLGLTTERGPGPTSRACRLGRGPWKEGGAVDAATDARLVWAPRPAGGVLTLLGGSHLIRDSESAAPTVLQLLAVARRTLATGTGELEPMTPTTSSHQ